MEGEIETDWQRASSAAGYYFIIQQWPSDCWSNGHDNCNNRDVVIHYQGKDEDSSFHFYFTLNGQSVLPTYVNNVF